MKKRITLILAALTFALVIVWLIIIKSKSIEPIVINNEHPKQVTVKDKPVKSTKFPCGVPASLVRDSLTESIILGLNSSKVSQNKLPTSKDSTGWQGLKAVFNLNYMWEVRWTNNKIHVYFMDTYDHNLTNKTIRVASEWSKHANLKFVLTNNISESDIRISFRENQGYKSAIGSRALYSDYVNKPTMWLQDLDNEPDYEFNRVVLHEFGHAIGLEHELQSPATPIEWDSVEAYKFYLDNYGWNQREVNDNVFKIIPTNEFTRFDPKSIMIYAVPKYLTKNDIEIPWPSELSLLDKKTIGKYYPLTK